MSKDLEQYVAMSVVFVGLAAGILMINWLG